MRFLWIILLFFPFILQAYEKHDFDYANFRRIPILHEGRIKPLDSFARIELGKIHGSSGLADKSAIAWLANTLFNPAKAVQERIFQLKDAEIVNILYLPEHEERFYSFNEMASAFSAQGKLVGELLLKDKKMLTTHEQEILRLYSNINDFAELIGTFSLLAPFPDDPDINYMTAVKTKSKIEAALKKTVKQKGDKIDAYTAEEQRDARLSFRMHILETLDSHNTLVRVIPPSWDKSDEWLAPWAVIEKGAGSPESAILFDNWKELLKAYDAGDKSSWDIYSEALHNQLSTQAGVREYALSLEVIYNTINPLGKSILLYIAGALAAFIALISSGRKWEVASYFIISFAAIVHGCALLARMLLLMRPPVSTLYESMIFVAFIVSCFGLWWERKRKSSESLFVCSVIAALLLTAANVFAADNDTLEVLIAVLNTNFWLGTHVVCITTGYAASLLAGAIAHIYLVKRAVGNTSTEALAALQKRLHTIALVALLFTSIGTMLGGIWADQSWGRFWGWDPKENGALWIVLWLVWALHGRLAGQLREIGFACALAFINIVVALAWVGVNLLSVGLHSYGFTDVAANGLIVFCAVEILFIATATVCAYKATN